MGLKSEIFEKIITICHKERDMHCKCKLFHAKGKNQDMHCKCKWCEKFQIQNLIEINLLNFVEIEK